jgi:hypothetical protein
MTYYILLKKLISKILCPSFSEVFLEKSFFLKSASGSPKILNRCDYKLMQNCTLKRFKEAQYFRLPLKAEFFELQMGIF